MPATYSVSFSGTNFAGVSVSGTQDLISMLASATIPFRVQRIRLAATGISSPVEVVIGRKRLNSSVSLGSGGTVVTGAALPEIAQSSGRLSTTTCHTNDTSRATTTGSTLILDPIPVTFPNNEDDIIVPEFWNYFPVSTAFVLGLEVAPAAAVTVYGVIYYTDLF